ncbi:MAG: hypothetical protein ACOC2D_21500 [Spirochaetota bacterium]
MRQKRIPLIAIALLLASAAGAQDLGVTLEVGSIERASAPRFLGDHLLFTYTFGPDRHDGRVHSVEVAFAHEDFSRLYTFERNANDVYVLLYEVPPELEEVRYRLVVDGIWTTDPRNPDRVVDRWGVALSRTAVPRVERALTRAPVTHPDGTVEFVVTAPPGSSVSVVGSFNGWDPYMTPLREVEPGRFSRRLRLGSGEHLYYYVVDGLRLPDPKNDRRRWHTSGLVVSVVSLD